VSQKAVQQATLHTNTSAKNNKIEKRIIIFGAIVIIAIISIIFFINQEETIIIEENQFTLEILSEKIKECNVIVEAEDLNDYCHGNYYVTNGCVHESELKKCPGMGGNWTSLQIKFNLIDEELEKICKEYIHSGMTASCLKDLSIPKCLEFANEEPYLKGICNYVTGTPPPNGKRLSNFQ
jgi:hypothetical protein